MNVVQKNSPYLAAIVLHCEGGKVSVMYPFKKRDQTETFPLCNVRAFSLKVVGNKVILMKRRTDPETIRNNSAMVRRYEQNVLKYLNK